MIEIAIADYLANAQAVSTIVSDRVYQQKYPPSPMLPAVRVSLIAEPAAYTLAGVQQLTRSTIQVDAAAAEASGGDPCAAALALADAIDGVLSGLGRVTIGGSPATVELRGVFRIDRAVGYDPEEELKIITCRQDFVVWWRAAPG